MTQPTIPTTIEHRWSWRCTNCDRYGHIEPETWTDHVLFVFERHFQSDHMIELWPTGNRHRGMYAQRVNGTIRVDRSQFAAMFPDTPPPDHQL